MIVCPKCNKRQDFNQIDGEIIMEKCGHTFVLEYVGFTPEG